MKDYSELREILCRQMELLAEASEKCNKKGNETALIGLLPGLTDAMCKVHAELLR